MKQAIQDVRTGEISVLDVPAPRPGRRQALIKTAASLISPGTERALADFGAKSLIGKARARPDLVRRTLEKAAQEGLLSTVEAVQNRLDQPMAMGYSSAGVIEQLGADMAGFRVGQRVICGGGGYAVHAELAVVPRNLMAPLPEEVSFEAGAFGTLAAIALHGMRLAQVQVGDRVAVIGLGLLGQLAMRLVDSAGARPWGVDLSESRVGAAREAGYSASTREQAEGAGPAFTAGRGFDSILICASTASPDPIELAGALARDRGRIVVIGDVGLQLPRRIYYEKELDLVVSRAYGPGRYDPSYEERGRDYPIAYVRWTAGRNLEAVSDLLASDKLQVEDLISYRFPIEEAGRAYELIRDQEQESMAVLLTYPTAETIKRGAVQLREREHQPQTGTIRLGLLGAGGFATSTALPALKRVSQIQLAVIASKSGLSSAAAGRRFGFENAVSDLIEILEDKSIDAIAILTPHDQHSEQVRAAIEAGKHVFCEKPPALNPEQLAGIAQSLIRSPGRVFTVGYNRRFAPLSTRLREFAAEVDAPCEILYRVNAGPLPEDHWLLDPQVGGGRLIGECGHFVDLISALAGSPAARVTAARSGGRPADPSYTVQIEFEDGSQATLVYATSGDRRLPKERLEYFGGGRAAVLDDFRMLQLIQDGRRRVHRSWLRQDKGHRAIWSRFVQAINEDQPPIPYDSLLLTSAVTFAAHASIERGQKVDPSEFLPG